MISRFKKHISKQVRSFKHEWLIRNTILSKMFLVYQAVLFMLIFHPIIFIIGFLVGVGTLSNPLNTGFDLLEDFT